MEKFKRVGDITLGLYHIPFYGTFQKPLFLVSDLIAVVGYNTAGADRLAKQLDKRNALFTKVDGRRGGEAWVVNPKGALQLFDIMKKKNAKNVAELFTQSIGYEPVTTAFNSVEVKIVVPAMTPDKGVDVLTKIMPSLSETTKEAMLLDLCRTNLENNKKQV